MSKSIDDGGPAFPVLPPLGPDNHEPSGYPFASDGMSLRDWFAGQALIGIVTGVNSNQARAAILAKVANEYGETITKHTAGQAYEIADAMLAARKPKGSES